LLKQLIHNGVIIPEPPPHRGLVIQIRGRPVQLTPKQEEMALAWAKKLGTPYVQDPVFVENYLLDFSVAMGFDPPLHIDDIDFTSVIRVVEAEREAKARLTREERKAQAAVRKAIRTELKEKYGYAVVNGQRVELGNYMTEPSGIFMGRGEHPLRGRWKEGASRGDVTLNLSPDAPRLAGDWAEIVWQPDSLWVARWKDRLSDRLKYVWLSDTAPVKQQREAAKFDKSIDLHDQLDQVRARIEHGMRDPDPRKRMIAMACYLIDVLCLRVGDEKDADEADTVGATTLRPEHVTLHPDGVVEFDFLGKDSVPWHKEIALPQPVVDELEELIRTARPSRSGGNGDNSHPTRDLPQLFPDIGSRSVNAFLSRIHKGLTAKVFRTHHATVAVMESLNASGVQASDPEYRKWHAAVMANYQAAVLCNHTKKYTGNWEVAVQRYEERLTKAHARRERYLAQLEERKERLRALQETAQTEAAKSAARRSIAALPERVRKKPELAEARLEKERVRYGKVKARYDARIARAKEQIEVTRGRIQRAEDAIGKIHAQREAADHKRTWNLGTSLKSYIDPRVYTRWGQAVEYDVLERYYPKTLRRKFAWARADEGPLDALPEGNPEAPERALVSHA
jgi:DNA topoisomerase-1